MQVAGARVSDPGGRDGVPGAAAAAGRDARGRDGAVAVRRRPAARPPGRRAAGPVRAGTARRVPRHRDPGAGPGHRATERPRSTGSSVRRRRRCPRCRRRRPGRRRPPAGRRGDQTTRWSRTCARGEGIALPVSLLVMVFVFGGFVAAGMPILGAVAAIGGGARSPARSSPTSSTSTPPSSTSSPCSGLGLSIDYGLLMVSRFREELRRAAHRRRATRAGRVRRPPSATMATAGRTVLFSGADRRASPCPV